MRFKPDGEPRRAPTAPSFTPDDNGVTFLIVCGGGTAVWTDHRIRSEQALGRRVHVVPTPTAAQWLESDEIEALTGWPMRPFMPDPLEPVFDPPGCRVLASPVTLNTLTKWAAGHADNLAISLLCEAVGLGINTRAEVSLSAAYARHPAAGEALERLTAMGVVFSRAQGGSSHPLLPEPDTTT